MKKLLYSFIIVLVARQSYAQFTNVKDTVFATMEINTEKSITDTIYNFGTSAIPLQWNVSSSTTIAPGHSGVSVCCFPGACYNFDNTVHTETINPSSMVLFILTWNVDATAQPGSTSYVVLNTNIGGGKNLVRKITVAGKPSTVGLAEMDLTSIKLYPQPSGDLLTVESPSVKASKIELLSSNGALLSTTPVSANLKTEINLSSLNAGLYIVTIYGADDTIIARRKINKI